jgi:hypothetical protein
MNGRVYDAVLARFISADPHIQAGSLSQSYNRYSYVMNNPLKYTDPSGYFFKKLFKKVKRAAKKIAGGLRKVGRALKPVAGIIVAAVVSIYCQACGAGIWNAVAAGAAAGATTAAVNGGNILKGAITGGISGAVFGGIGLKFTGNEAILAHAFAGGAMSVVRGGKFGEGFLSAGFAKFAMLGLEKAGYLKLDNRDFDAVIGRTTIAAVVGGTASAIGGGKFANGAQTAAFAHLLNAELSEEIRLNKLKNIDIAKLNYSIFKDSSNKLFEMHNSSPADISVKYNLTADNVNEGVFRMMTNLRHFALRGASSTINSSINLVHQESIKFIGGVLIKRPIGQISYKGMQTSTDSQSATASHNINCYGMGCRLNIEVLE